MTQVPKKIIILHLLTGILIVLFAYNCKADDDVCDVYDMDQGLVNVSCRQEDGSYRDNIIEGEHASENYDKYVAKVTYGIESEDMSE